jgi:2,4-dienoyl-CoA reductase-like NADH-dependent reductase (Old Yellow Enzyme family)
MNHLFQPLKLGSLTLKNRIIMAPLTRSRAGIGRVPNDIMVKYYRERASAGLILTEATCISAKAVGYANTPGIWSKDQVLGWKKITQAIHQENGLVFVQLWHVGRISHPSLLDGDLPVAPSAIKPRGHVSLIRPETAFVTPRALNIAEIKNIIAEYKAAAINAKEAQFDGVEIHAANGYLIDQFLQDGTNKRNDEYGGAIENRARFLLEVVDTCIEIWGADRVGVHLAPRGDSHDMHDSNREATFGYVGRELGRRKIAFIFTREYEAADSISAKIKEEFGGVLIANEKFTKDSAEQAIQAKKADAVAFGVPYIANPDLVKRFELNRELNPPRPETFYAEGEIGYNDYPHLKD